MSSPLVFGIAFCAILTVLITFSILVNKEPVLGDPKTGDDEMLRVGMTLAPFVFCSGVLYFKRPDPTSFAPRALAAIGIVTLLCLFDSLRGLDQNRRVAVQALQPTLRALWSFLVLRTVRSHVDPPIMGFKLDAIVFVGIVLLSSGSSSSLLSSLDVQWFTTWFSLSAILEGVLRVRRHQFAVPELVQLAGILATAHGAGQYSKTWDWNMVDRWMSCVALVVVAICIRVH
jgi:hypothetical protein